MKNRMKEKRAGFTLVELVVVLVILSILIAIMIPSLAGYIDKEKEKENVNKVRRIYAASSAGLTEWMAIGSPGNSDNIFKKNIENEIIEFLELGEMQSFTATNNTKDVVQVGLSLPTYYSQGWSLFISKCKDNDYRNFALVWVGKESQNGPIGDTIKGIYYVSADGKYASWIVYDGETKLGSPDQKTGVHTEQIK